MPKLAIDNVALGSAIERQDSRMTLQGDQYRTSSELRLQREVDRKVEIQATLIGDETQLADLRSQRARLDALIEKGEANVKDARIELKSILASIHDLEDQGISLK